MSRAVAGSAAAPEGLALPTVFDCSVVDGDPDAVCVRVGGELDIATAPRLELALGEALLTARLVVLDLRDVAFIDCSGVRVIVSASVLARELARRLVILRGPAGVDRMFSLTGSSGPLEFAGPGSLGPVCAEASRRRRSASRAFLTVST